MIKIFLFLLLPLSCFAQGDSTLKISKRIGILTVQDLIRFDGLKVTDSLVKSQLEDYKRIVINQGLIISGMMETERNHKIELDNQKALKENSDLAYKNEVKKTRKLWIVIGGFLAYIGYTTFVK